MRHFTFRQSPCHDEFATPTGMLMLEAALEYAGHGLPLLPLHTTSIAGLCSCTDPRCTSRGKHPATKNGFHDASSNPAQIERWWHDFPQANIGLLTGQTSGLIVLDIDHQHQGFESLAHLEDLHSPLPVSRRVRTGGKGLHIYFKHPGIQLKNKVNILPGIDFRGDGGYIVAPPSRHASGDRYQWIDQHCDIAEMPSWLFGLLSSKQTAARSNLKDSSRIKEGLRNNTLTSIGGFLRAKGIGMDTLERILGVVNKSSLYPPLEPQEVTSIANSLSKYEAGKTWEQPLPLPQEEIEAINLQETHLPSAFRKWLIDIADRMQVSIEFVAAPAIIAAATVIGRKISIKPLQNDDWTVIPNLWGFLAAEPGAMKSPAIAAAMKPLMFIETKERNKFQKQCIDTQKLDKTKRLEIEALKQALKVDLRSDFLEALAEKQGLIQRLEQEVIEQEEPKEKRYKTNDPTVEKLALILRDNPQGILLLRDELSGWLSSLTRPGREGNREFYLETWNGSNSFTVDRVGRGSVHVEALCLSIFGGIQPAKLQEYIDSTSTAAGDDGFLERFQIVFYPNKRKNFELIDRKPDELAFDQVLKAMMYLEAMPWQDSLRFSSEVLAAA